MPNPKLYLLVRTDMDSMNAGKAMAQVAHAGTKFVYHTCIGSKSPYLKEIYNWLGPNGFGTKIVLAVPSLEKLQDTIDTAVIEGYPGDVVYDETYPLRDGQFTHYIPVITCGYIFDHDGLLNSNPMIGLTRYKLR